MTNKQKSRIIQEMQETVAGLHKSGLITKKSMEEFEALRNLDIKPMTASRIKRLRVKTRLSQAVFAVAINTSLSTIQKWEAGDKKPSGPSLKLLSLIERKGLEVVLWLSRLFKFFESTLKGFNIGKAAINRCKADVGHFV